MKPDTYIIKDENGVDVAITATVEEQLDSAFLTKLNAERVKLGAPELKRFADWDEGVLTRALETTVQFSHTRPNESDYKTAFPTSSQPTGENIASGQATADAVYQAWFNSTLGHKEQMLNATYTHTAVICIRVSATTNTDASDTNFTYYWVQVFGKF